MIEGTMKCYKYGKRSYDDNVYLDEETGLPCWRSSAEEDLCSVCAKQLSGSPGVLGPRASPEPNLCYHSTWGRDKYLCSCGY